MTTRFWTVKEVAERLRVSAGAVYELCAKGKLPHHRLGIGRGTIRIADEDLEQFVAASRVEQPSPVDAGLGLRHIRIR